MNFSTSSNIHNRSSTKFNWSSMGGGATGADGSSPLFAPGLGSGPSVINSSVKIRMAFLRKVYTILSVQLLFTTVVSAAIMFMPSVQAILFSSMWFLLATVVANLAVTFTLMYKRNEYPMNFYLLGAFTLLNAISVGSIVSLYDLGVVIQAVFLTGAIVVGLTLYTFNSKSDFTWLNSILFASITVMTMAGFVHLFTGNNFTHTVLTGLGAFIFSLYIIYDTQMIMKHLSADEYIVAVINLYVDIINLFVRILRLLDQLKNEESRKEKRRR